MMREILRICKERAIEYPPSKSGGGLLAPQQRGQNVIQKRILDDILLPRYDYK